MKEKVYAIVTMYKPNIKDFSYNLKKLSPQVDNIIILDNSEIKEYYMSLLNTGIFDNLANIRYYKMEKNLGLGAINNGIQIAIQEGAQYVLLMDQDSTPNDDTVLLMYKAIRHLETKGIKTAAIGPSMINKRTNEPFKSKLKIGKSFNEYLEEVDQLPTSGLLIPVEVFEKVGLLCEELFLDIVDFEWCWRAKSKGYKIFKHKKSILYHELGIDSKKLWFIEYNVPTPERHYYLFRNSIFVVFCKYAPFYIRLRYFIMLLIKIFILNVFPDNKKMRIKFTIKGIRDGVKKWVFGLDSCIPQR